ncbi:MAG TPA: phage portal protein [Candidatus Saccharicenans sp.]|nr:phage portal protein [Candidatus Saccharicenans sp.]
MSIFSRKKKEEVVQEMKAASQTIQPPYSSAGMYFWGLGGYHSDQFSNAIDAYCRNYALFACVTKIAKAVGGLEFELWGPKGKIDQHPILDMLYNPNLSEGSRSFYQRLTTHLLLAGNAYVYIAKSGQTGSLFLVNPIGMEVVIDSETGLIAGYKFKGKRIREFKKEEICHIRHPHPGNDYYGLPFYLPGQQLADILALTEKWNLALLHNDMRPPGIIVTDEPLGPTKKREIQTKFESEWAGAANAGRSVFLEGGLEWKPAGMTIKDADWVEMMKVYLRQMAALFDVPSELLGDSENKTYSNMKEARRAFYLETVLPLCDFIIDEFNRSIVPLWGKGMWLQIDRANIEALQDDWKERAQLVNQLDFLMINEKRKYIGHEEIPGGNVVMGTFNDIPLITVNPSGKTAKQSPTQTTTKMTTKGDQFWAPRERKSILWKAYKSRTDRMAAKLEPAIDQWLRDVARQLSYCAKKGGIPKILEYASQEELSRDYQQFMRPAYEEMLILGFRAGQRAARKDIDYFLSEKQADPDDIPVAWREKFNALVELMMIESGTQVAKTTILKIKKIIEEAQMSEPPLSVMQLAEKIWDDMIDWAGWKARLWAFTETAKLDNFGQLEGMKEEGTEFKGWLCSMLPTSREDHIQADEEYSQNPIPISEDFIIGGQAMAYPGDPKAGPEQVCNCRCTLLPY